MKNSKRVFLFIEMILGSMVVVLASLMIREKNGDDLDKIAVIVQNSDDNQWTAFQYGLKMAAEDKELELCMVSTGETITAEELKSMINQEIEKGADGIIVQPVPGEETVNILKKTGKKFLLCWWSLPWIKMVGSLLFRSQSHNIMKWALR